MTSSKPVNIFLRFCLSSIIAITGLVGTSLHNSVLAARGEPAHSSVQTGSLIPGGSLYWNTFLGGNGDDWGFHVARDAGGNIYVAGFSDATWGSPVRAFAGGARDAFVAKLDSNGTLLWNTFLGGTGEDEAWGIAVDAGGNVRVTGYSYFAGWGNPVNPYAGSDDAFVAKLGNNGVLLWNTFLGSGGADFGFGIALDAGGNSFVTGESSMTWGSPLSPFPSGASGAAFVAKLDDGGVLTWNTFLGSGKSSGRGIAVDGAGNLYLTGASTATWGSPVSPFGSGTEAFVAKLNSSAALVWNTFLTGSNTSGRFLDLALDANTNAYIVGYSGTTWGSPVRAFTGGGDAFVAKVGSSGALLWNTFLGGTAEDAGGGIALDPDANVYVTGDSLASWGNPVRPFVGNYDAFVAKLGSSGALLWNTFLGGAGDDGGSGIAVDGQGSVYTSGLSLSTWGNPIRSFSGPSGSDAFLVKLLADQLSGLVVTNANDSGPGSLRQAIIDAAPGDTILFDPALAGQSIRLSSMLIVNQNLTIDGQGLSPHVQISGDTDGDGKGNVAVLQTGAGTVNLRSLDIVNGRNDGTLPGGIDSFGTLNIIDCTLSGNYGGVAGAIVGGPTLTITNSILDGNVGFEGGGAIHNYGTLIITNSTFSNNRAISFGAGGYGGAIENRGVLTVRGSFFSMNYGELGGGAIANTGAKEITVSDSTFSNNSTAGDGGAIYYPHGGVNVGLDVSHSSFDHNSANMGGAISAGPSDGSVLQYINATISDSVFEANTAVANGGAVSLARAWIMSSITSSLFKGNQAHDAGAVVSFTPLTVQNSTFYGNIATDTAQGAAGGLINPSTTTATELTLENNTFSGNSGGAFVNLGTATLINNILANSSNGPDCLNTGTSTITMNTGNLIETNSGCGAAAVTADPMLGPLADNGGPTFTMALQPGSPAIDAGNDANCPATDQRGFPRPQGAHCDIGAYELNNTLALLLSPSGLVPAGWDGTFQWTGVTGASMYYVQILQANDTNVWTQWYPAADNCTRLDCHITLSSLSNLPTGAYKWRVLDWGGYGYGAWTAFTPFNTIQACYALTTSVAPAGSGVVNATAPNCGANYLAGTVVQLTAVPNAGYVFNNWSGGASGTANPVSITMTGDMTVTANLRETSSTLVSPSGAVPAGWDGTFQWTGVTGASMYYVQILQANDTNVWTQWFDAAGNCTGLSCHITLSSLSNLPTGAYKWRVLDWGSYGYGAWTDFTAFTTNPACYALTTSVLPAGSGVVNATAPNCGANYLAGTVVQLSAVPNSGYLFNNWSGGASGTANPVSITMTGDMTVTANLRETSSTLVSPSGAVPAGWDGTFQWTGVTGASMYYVQILQANDANVWTQWFDAAGNCTGLSCHITLSSLSNLPTEDYKWRVLDWGGYGYGAWTDFTPFTTNTACYALTTSVLPAGSGVVNATAPNCGANYLAGTVVQLTAVPNAGYVFNNWSGGVSGTANPVSITMTGDMTVTANLRETSSTLVSPSGAVPAGWDGTFQWTGVTGASMYYVQILQANDANVWTQWFDAAGNCTGLSCHITLSSLSSLPTGTYKWRVLDWGDYGYGAWTDFTDFQVNAQPTTLYGTLAQNTTLTAAGNPYVISCGLLVASGATLTIQEGAIL